jgi:polysaccharide export outer membrane protein
MSNPSSGRIKKPAAWRQIAIAAVVALACVPQTANAEYLLSVGDVVAISVVGLRDMQQTIPIDVDGKASFPLIGRIQAAGVSVFELQQKVRAQLPDKVFRRRTEDGRESQVALSPDEIMVTIAEYQPIYVNGDVAKPGAQAYRPGMTIRQAITLAGGFDTMRFRTHDPFLESADFRADYYALWTEFARQQVRIARLKAELAGKSQLDRAGFADGPIPASVVAQIEDLEARALTSRNDDHAKEKAHLQQAIKSQDHRIAVLTDNFEKERQGAQADANDFVELQEKFNRGVIPMLRMSDARRFTLYSASQSLQTEAQLSQAQRDREDLARSLQRVDDQRKIDLLKELQDTEVTFQSIRSRVRAAADKLMYAGMAKSQFVRGAGGKPDLKVFRNVDNVGRVLDPNESSPLMPGDVVEVALHLEGIDGEPPSVQPDQSGH